MGVEEVPHLEEDRIKPKRMYKTDSRCGQNLAVCRRHSVSLRKTENEKKKFIPKIFLGGVDL